MKIEIQASALKQTQWYEYAIRFVFGGLVTMFTGFVVQQYGPVIGGLFLAFPSIFPASLTLIQKHKEKKEEQKGKSEEASEEKGKDSASQAALGTMLGSPGLVVFGLVIWKLSGALAPWLVLLIAVSGWFATAFAVWWILIGRTGRKG